jgi:hypothetical protein
VTPEDTKYFDDLENMFGTLGWRTLIEEAKAEIYQLQADMLEVKSWDEVLVKRGRALALQDLVDKQEVVAQARKTLEEADADIQL